MESPFVSSGGWPDQDERVASGSLLLYQAGGNWMQDSDLGHGKKRQTCPMKSMWQVWRYGRGIFLFLTVVSPKVTWLSLNYFYGSCIFGCFRRVSIV